jgi:hypothetical protein
MKGEVIRLSNGTYKAFVTDAAACNILNHRLRQYPDMPDFVAEGSEGIFSFTAAEHAFVQAVLRVDQ